MNVEKSLLLIDNSNTRTKVTLAKAGKVCGEVRSMPTQHIGERNVSELLKGWVFEEVVLCSVVPRAADALCAQLSEFPLHDINWRDFPRLVRLYDHPSCIGADRLVNAAALAAHYELPALAVDLGTACTFDAVALVDGEPTLLGGVITPGLRSLSLAPARSTGLLPELSLGDLVAGAPPEFPARTTHDALRSGVLLGYEYMVRGIVERMMSVLGSEVKVVVTGGDAALPNGQTPTWAHVLDPLLTFRGMLEYAAQ